ncbi:uncharacterized protein LOC113852408 [Abrus precatorius]|uniref:E3 ubiquitin-protein ligase RMA n=1 Tax=Abrus precatorius TaxID=3816 RepID=A0A8B8K5R2_ABRPR|nr:uncharacterized protein LOC113852408 [Abrus precatorius]
MEPLNPAHASVVEFDSLLEELESAHERVQDRIRHLEAITSRARQRQRWPLVHTPLQITNFFTGEAAVGDAQDDGLERQEVEERMVERSRGSKRKGVHLVAQALEVETDGNKKGESTGNFFDCNICLDMARDPVLTCCGHLFCWACFYQLAYAYSNARECPVCNGEVTETGIVPIYGNSSGSGNYDLRVPPRPAAPRTESFRQQLISQGASSAIIQSIRRFNNLIGGLGERVQSESHNTTAERNNALPTRSRLQIGNGQQTGSAPISRLLVQGAASFSSLSSALNSAMDSAERLVEDLESYIHDHPIGGSRQLNHHAVDRNSTFNGNVTNVAIAATDSLAASSTSPFGRNVDTNADIGSEIQTTDSNRLIVTETRPLEPSSSYSGTTDVSTSRQVSNDPRRRRLRFLSS